MTDSEKLDLLLSEMQGMKAEMQDMKAEMKDRLSVVEDKVSALENKVVNISLHIENVTDKNIQLIAENFIELTKKLNAAKMCIRDRKCSRGYYDQGTPS